MTSYRSLTFPARDRDLRAEHRFVRSAWVTSYKNSNFAGIIAAEDWADVMHGALSKIFARPGVRTILAYKSPSFFYGFIVGEPAGRMPIVHYVYVKDAYRSERAGDRERKGPRLARGLFAALGVDPKRPFLYTCQTEICFRLRERIPQARFAPAAIRYSNYLDHQERSP